MQEKVQKYETTGWRKIFGIPYAQLCESFGVYGKGLIPKDYKSKKC